MSQDPSPASVRLDEVEAGLDAVEAALARLDAGDTTEPPVEAGPAGELAAGTSADPEG